MRVNLLFALIIFSISVSLFSFFGQTPVMNPIDLDQPLKWESRKSIQNAADALTRPLLMKACEQPLDPQQEQQLLADLRLLDRIYKGSTHDAQAQL